MKGHRFIIATIFLGVSMSFSSCRKDISLPDPSLSKLFGSWEWVQTSGGFAGEIITPSSQGFTQSISFESNGIYKLYKDGIQKEKKTFTLSEGISILTNTSAWMIRYKDTGIGDHSENAIAQSVRFSGQDSLFLADEAFDGYNYVYIRK
ncbi:MAG: hypothetical protein WCL06_09540 [Bacteroidota bacterium]